MHIWKVINLTALLSSTCVAFSVTHTPSSRSVSSSSLNMGLLDFLGLGGGKAAGFDGSCVMGEESIMSPKSHGTSEVPVQEDLRWDCDVKVADNICNFNRYVREAWMSKMLACIENQYFINLFQI
jgi:hypothetical protein